MRISEKLADAIIRGRPYRSMDELLSIAGVGQKILGRLKAQGLIVGGTPRKEQDMAAESERGIIEAIASARSKYSEAIAGAQRDRQTSIGKAWAEYNSETSELSFRCYRAWIDSYNAYLDAFAKLPAQPDEEAIEAASSAWARHVEACQPNPDTARAVLEVEAKLVDAVAEAERAYRDAEQSGIREYSEAVDSALSAHGLSRLDAAQAQLVATEIVARGR